ncbi:MAG: 50S ribosomal protein L18 [Candidatus Aureabacteria bacterium]|nr:50S ribosomal protein L18 [Candidatus Auribacterota bacterium]
MKEKTAQKERRHKRIRKKVIGVPDCPRLCVFRSSKNMSAQLIDDMAGVSLVGVTTASKSFGGKGGSIEAAKKLGKLLAGAAKEKKIEKVVFDRAGYKYHGRVKAFTEGAREGGLKF